MNLHAKLSERLHIEISERYFTSYKMTDSSEKKSINLSLTRTRLSLIRHYGFVRISQRKMWNG